MDKWIKVSLNFSKLCNQGIQPQVPMAGVEPALPKEPDLKSGVSTIFHHTGKGGGGGIRTLDLLLMRRAT